ncbi:MAG: hypothetical protein N2662_01835 [Bacteroidales bacterium]|nr:hypothetical protein [Bacteroidales bacterium]
MKLIIYMLIVFFVLVSCTTSKYEIVRNSLPIVFEDLSRNDYTIVHSLTADVTLTGRIKSNKKVYDTKILKNDKTYYENKYIYSDIFEFEHYLYNESSVNLPLYYVDSINLLFFTIRLSSTLQKITKNHHVLVALSEKYPNIDYFTNVRFESNIEVKGNKKFTEYVKVIADGIELRTDNN